MEVGSLFNDRYSLRQELSQNSFTKVFQVYDEKLRRLYALKLFLPSSSAFNTELDVYRSLQPSSEFCSINSCGQSELGSYLIMTLLKEPVSRFIQNSSNFYSTIVDFSYQLISRLEFLHRSSFVHRKLSPNNLMVDFDKSNPTLFLIDFSASKRFREPVSKIHHKYFEGREFSSILHFCSVNSQRGIDYTRRDDIESWAYLTIFWLKNKLPWDFEAERDLFDKVLSIKSIISPDKLCEDLPADFLNIFKYIKTLRYEEQPNYEFIKMSLNQMKEKFSNFDTTLVKTLKSKKSKKNNKERSGSAFFSASAFVIQQRRKSSNTKSIVKFQMGLTQSTEPDNSFACNQFVRRNRDRDSTVKGVMPEFKDKSIIFNQ